MPLHQLTHTATFEFEINLGIATSLRRLLARAAGLPRRWNAQRLLDLEMAMLDHRERSDLGFRN